MSSRRTSLATTASLVLGITASLAFAAGQATAEKTGAKASAQPNDIKLNPAEAAATEEKTSDASDAMEDRQSFNTYTSLEDGQPGQPGEFQINFFNGWETSSGERDRWLMEPEIEYTLGRTSDSFLRNTKLGLRTPLQLGTGAVDGNGDIEFYWIQRWITEQEGGWCPTFSTVNEIRIPSGYESEKVDWTMTGVLAKELGPGTAYLNAYLKSANGSNNIEKPTFTRELLLGEEEDDLRNFQWGFRFGYKWRINEKIALIADYVLESSEMRGNHNRNTGEVSAEWRVTDHLTIGPGIYFGLDGAEETPNFGAGLALHYSFE
jgi:hypothetical protein